VSTDTRHTESGVMGSIATNSDGGVPRGRARAEALAEIVAEARRRMLATPSPLDSITREQLAEYRANPLPEILGAGPERTANRR